MKASIHNVMVLAELSFVPILLTREKVAIVMEQQKMLATELLLAQIPTAGHLHQMHVVTQFIQVMELQEVVVIPRRGFVQWDLQNVEEVWVCLIKSSRFYHGTVNVGERVEQK